MWGPGYGYHGMMVGGWVLGIFLMIAFWALVIMAIIWLVRSIRRGNGPQRFRGQEGSHRLPYQAASAEAILAERFARGEVNEDEYRARLAALRGSFSAPTPPPPAPPAPQGPPPAPQSPPPSV